MERFYHVGIVVPDLDAAKAYYTELLRLEGESLQGSGTSEWVRRVAVGVVQGLEAGF